MTTFLIGEVKFMFNKSIEELVHDECKRQNRNIELIASENVASKRVRALCGSILTNKYAEGYPLHRYYGGCKYIDMIESRAIENACKLFGAKYANVQPHSGSQANFAAYKALMPDLERRGGTILSIVLSEGGHLTHGSPVNFSGKLLEVTHYKLNANGKLDYDNIYEVAMMTKPDVIVAGFSAYPYEVDFKRFRSIADACGAKLMVDMAHIAGLVAAGLHENPVPYADIVTSTTHKTLRGPRGGLILTNNAELAEAVDKAIFPYSQGGPLEHIIAAKAVCFEDAMTKQFRNYIESVLYNTRACAREFAELGAVVSRTENHLFLLDTMRTYNMTGKEAQEALEKINITANKNTIPGDTLGPVQTSGLRIGFAAATTRGCTAKQAIKIANIIHFYLKGLKTAYAAKLEVATITKRWLKVEDI